MVDVLAICSDILVQLSAVTVEVPQIRSSTEFEGGFTLLAQCLVRHSYWGAFCTYFLREGGTRILMSILSCSPEEAAALVVDNRSGMFYAGNDSPLAVSLSILGRLGVWRSVHSRCFIYGICQS